MNALFKLFDTLNDHLANITSLAVVMGDADYENFSAEILGGYMSTLINLIHEANHTCQKIQEFFTEYSQQ